MKLWKDRDELTPVRWFFCKPGAKVFEKLSSFRSLKTWDRESDRAGMVGEKLGVTPYDKGTNSLGYEGLRHCGSDLAMQEGGESGRDQVIVTTGSGDNPCCKTPPTAGVCIPTTAGLFKPRLPMTLLATIVDRGICSRFAGAQFLLLNLGSGDVYDLSEPGGGLVFAGGMCAWSYMSAQTIFSDGPILQEWMVLGVQLGANAPGQPEGCPESNCAFPRVYWKVCTLNKGTGVTTVETNFVQTFPLAFNAIPDPLEVTIADDNAGMSVFGCELGGSNALTRTWVRLQG